MSATIHNPDGMSQREFPNVVASVESYQKHTMEYEEKEVHTGKGNLQRESDADQSQRHKPANLKGAWSGQKPNTFGAIAGLG